MQKQAKLPGIWAEAQRRKVRGKAEEAGGHSDLGRVRRKRCWRGVRPDGGGVGWGRGAGGGAGASRAESRGGLCQGCRETCPRAGAAQGIQEGGGRAGRAAAEAGQAGPEWARPRPASQGRACGAGPGSLASRRRRGLLPRAGLCWRRRERDLVGSGK